MQRAICGQAPASTCRIDRSQTFWPSSIRTLRAGCRQGTSPPGAIFPRPEGPGNEKSDNLETGRKSWPPVEHDFPS